MFFISLHALPEAQLERYLLYNFCLLSKVD